MERLEIKFDISEKGFLDIYKNLSLKKSYPERTITSIYYDTIDLRYFYDSEEGICPRIKVRKRFYNKSKDYIFELKKNDFFNRSKISDNSIQDINSFRKKYAIKNFLYPKVKIIYKRKYYDSLFGRVTIDSNIFFYRLDMNENCIQQSNLKKTILEVKNLNVKNKIFILNKVNLNDERISKYCEAILKFYV